MFVAYTASNEVQKYAHVLLAYLGSLKHRREVESLGELFLV